MPNMKHHVEYANLAEAELSRADRQLMSGQAEYHVGRAQVYATLALAAVQEEAAGLDRRRSQ